MNSGRAWRCASLVALVLGGSWLAIRMQSPDIERFTISRGASVREIAQRLHQHGVIWHPWSFMVWARIKGRNAIRPGIYGLSRRMTTVDVYRLFKKGPPAERITFPEGWTSQQVAALLESRGITAADPFQQLVNQKKLEGFLFPDTYFFEQGLEPQQVIDRMVRRFHEMEPSEMTEQTKALKLTYLQIVTLASLVEKEARVPEERPLIAGVYYNRLRRRMYLQADPTVQYALGGWKPQLTYKDLQINSPYNTYKHSGLPPGPICNPGQASLQAAAHPLKTDFLFFVANPTGRHVFSKTYAEHLAIQRQMRKNRQMEGAAR